ncbi:MAG: 30S ribosomal protein S16 [Acidobacteria bacterium]|nr:30S ribosomal protein S16 [Acidobacteriota bacterium]
MVTIRLKRLGRKKSPFYRIVVVERRNSRAGKVLETLGHYNPLPAARDMKVDRERAAHWISKGAVVSETVKTLLAAPAS